MSESSTEGLSPSSVKQWLGIGAVVASAAFLSYFFWPEGDAGDEPTACSADQELVGGVCECTGGRSPDASGACSCTIGETFEASLGVCVPKRCPTGQNLNSAGDCVALTTECPPGRVLGPGGACECLFRQADVLIDGAPQCVSLEGSDPYVRGVIEEISGTASDKYVGANRQLINALVRLTNDVRIGAPFAERVRARLDHLKPQDKFSVVDEKGLDSVLDSASYRRHDAFVNLFASLDPATLVSRYEESATLFDQAHQEQGYSGSEFKPALLEAIDVLLAAPVERGRITLYRPSVMYRFADERLENLPYVHKALLRMGPENTIRLQAKLGELRDELQ